MGRAHCREVILDKGGNVVVGAVVTVKNFDTGATLADTLYAGDSGATALDNPLTSDDSGVIEFYLDTPQRVTLSAVHPVSGQTGTAVFDVVDDPEDVTPGGQTPAPHVLTGELHTETGLTAGHVLQATAATTYGFDVLPAHSILGASHSDVDGDPAPSDGDILTYDTADSKWHPVAPATAAITGMVETKPVLINGGGSEIADGAYVDVPFDYGCTLSTWTILADASGAIKIDVWKDTYANFPPTNDDSMCNGHEPEIAASAAKAQDTDLSDWTTTTISAGDVLRFNVDSCTTIKQVTIGLKLVRT